jgi:hypothetical protein
MNEIKITEKDLMGEIKDFPIEVVRKMVEEQVRQGNKADVGVFQECAHKVKKSGGFEWKETEYGFDFWNMVIIGKEFDEFFEKYPKQETTEMQDAENTATQAYKEIDWEQRRYEIAKEAICAIMSNEEFYAQVLYEGAELNSRRNIPCSVTHAAVVFADALIAELKKGGSI